MSCLCQPIRVSMSSVEHSNCLQGQADVGSGTVFGTLPARKWQNIMALRAVLFVSSKIASNPNVGKETNKLDYHRRGSWIYVSSRYLIRIRGCSRTWHIVSSFPFQPTSLLGSSMSHWHHSREHPLTSCNTHSRWYGRNGLREQIPWSQAGPWGNMEQRQIQQFSLPSDAEWFRNSGVVEKFCQIRNLQWTPHLRSVTLNFLMNIILMTPQQSGSIPRSSTEWQTAGTIRGFSHLPCNARHMRQDPCESLQEKTSEEWSSLANLLLVWEAAKCC